MLIEVPFINGYKEFEEILSKEIIIEIKENTLNYTIDLLDTNIIPESISYVNLSEDELFINLRIINSDRKDVLHITSSKNLNNTLLKIIYSYNNKNPKGLYSVDYDSGTIYFSEETSKRYNIKYNYDSILCIGKDVNQLDSKDFIHVNKNINISNFKENSYIYFVYKNKAIISRNITPILQNLKLNYITRDEKSL